MPLLRAGIFVHLSYPMCDERLEVSTLAMNPVTDITAINPVGLFNFKKLVWLIVNQ